MDAIEVVPGLAKLVKRSAVLNGSLPVRGAQHCPPVREGNAAGWQIELTVPIALQRGRRGWEATTTGEMLELLQDRGPRAIEALVAAGRLPKGGYWHRLLGESALRIVGNRVRFWTGYLVRARPGVRLLVTRAFNRHCDVNIDEQVISSGDDPVPLVVEMDLSDGDRARTLCFELACVTPLSPGRGLDIVRLEDASEIGRAYLEFHDQVYFQKKSKGATRRYYRVFSQETSVPSTERSRLVLAAPSRHARLGSFNKFVDLSGVKRDPARRGELPFAQIQNLQAWRAEWDGRLLLSQRSTNARDLAGVKARWAALYGDQNIRGVEALAAHYAPMPVPEENWFIYFARALMQTPPGWSSIIDGAVVLPEVTGMRGVVWTDRYFAIQTVFKIYRPIRFTIPPSKPMLRIIPVPRSLLDGGLNLTHEPVSTRTRA